MRKLIFILIALAMANIAASQTANPKLNTSSGDSFTNDTYQLDWSVGEIVTSTHSAGDLVLTQGFHQGNYISTLVDDLFPDMQIAVFPNPTSDILNLAGFENRTGLTYTVTDMNGNLLQNQTISSDTEEIDFSSFSNGIYFISVSRNNQSFKTFKIIKNN